MDAYTRDILKQEVLLGERVGKDRERYLNNFFAEKEQAIFDDFRALQIPDPTALANLWHQLRALDDLKGHVTSLMDTAKMASHQLTKGDN